MKTTIVGYPRIGSLRELKFAEEKYFRKEITAAELETAAEKFRLENLSVQRTGRKNWLLGQIIFLMLSALTFMLGVIISTII